MFLLLLLHDDSKIIIVYTENVRIILAHINYAFFI